MTELDESDYEEIRPGSDDPEIVIGLVGAVGARLDLVCNDLDEEFDRHDYSVERFSISDEIEGYSDMLSEEAELVEGPEDERIRAYQKGGNELRALLGNDALALITCGSIRDFREEETGSRGRQIPRQAFILDSLKHPDEVDVLRNIYGEGFILISVYTPTNERKRRLASDISGNRSYELGENPDLDSKAEDIIEIDRHEEDKDYGQNVRDTFPKGDIFLDSSNRERLSDQVGRCVDLIFGAPFETPNQDEQCMYIAEAARLRSAALGRQVGAALARPEGEVISIGCNDVPTAGGGLYWPDDEFDFRDFRLGENISHNKRLDALKEILENLHDEGALVLEELDVEVGGPNELDYETLNHLMDRFDDTRLSSLIEFYRSTHAEMEAILSASRKGVPIEDASLYSTTFPCHECTRHIIAAGIERVVYIQPYPKSLGPNLHGDAMEVIGEPPLRELWDLDETGKDLKVKFEPFVGVGPRIYEKVFEAKERKEDDGSIMEWPPEEIQPIFGTTHSGWIIDETLGVRDINERVDNIDS